jgi:hypothetical protein
MPLNNITFNLGQGGLGRPLPGNDHISGLLIYSATLPSGFSTSSRVKKLLSLADAVSLGITNGNLGETRATATYLVTGIGSAGNTVTITVITPSGTITLCTYTVLSTDTTATILAASITAAINANTVVTGFTALSSTATITITAAPGLGVYLNTGTPYTVTIVGTVAGTLTQSVVAGVASIINVWYYHISEFFRIQPKGVLYVGIYAVPGSYTFTEITTMQNFSGGIIRQIGVYKDGASAFASADITAIHNVCAANVAVHKEIIALYAADISGTADVTTLPDLSALSANLCSAVIGQDGAAQGYLLYSALGKSITTLGATLGAVAKAKVSQSIAWVGQFNISNGVECDVLAFANGVLFSNSSVTDTVLSTVQGLRYIFLRKFVGVAGSYFNENSTAINTSSNYAYIADNRTIQKATRGVYASMIPALNSPIVLKADGTLSDQAVSYFEGLGDAPLLQMVRDGELSAGATTVNTTQNIQSTGILVVTIKLVQIATGRNITVNIGYSVTL